VSAPPDVSVVGVTTQRRFQVVGGGGFGPHAALVREVLARVSLGPAWPLLPVTVQVREEPESFSQMRMPRVRLKVATRVDDRDTGSLIDITFNETISALNEHQILADFRRILEGILLHELRESLLVDGQLLDDPHKDGR
jgi:hypothetical protein